MKEKPMKKLKLLFAFIALILVAFACDPENEIAPTELSDTELIEAIQSASDLQEISQENLPNEANTTLSQEYSESFLSQVQIAPSLGYAVTMRQETGAMAGRGENVYFDLNGRRLDPDNEGVHKRRPKNRRKKGCFEIVYPVSFVMPDASLITLESKKDRALIKDWYEANPDIEEEPSLFFPVDFTLEDGSTQTINSEAELETLMDICDDRHHKRCFEFVYPFSLTMPDASTITLNSKEDRKLVKEWYEANPDTDEDPEFVYPISVTLEDGTTQTINDETELDALIENCEGDDDGDD